MPRPSRSTAVCTFALALLALPLAAYSQSAPSKSTVERTAAGDSPTDPGPLATNLSPKLNPADIQAAMRKVADWQLSAASRKFNQQWTFAALYDGFVATSRTTGDPKYINALTKIDQSFDWKLIDERFPHADDQAIGQSMLDLYKLQPEPVRIANTKAIMDRLLTYQDDPAKPLWWWCDALFMAPPVLVRLYSITGDKKYLDLLDHEWDITTALLYDPQEQLFFRDATYLKKTEKNGKPLFWARGNGWVLAGLANVLQYMPADYPARPRYVAQFKAMAARIAALQTPDGLWKTGLLDPGGYTNGEVSGTAFFTFAMAWGINEHILDPKVFGPVVTKSWNGMLTHIYASGRLGAIQPIGAAPDAFTASSSYVYGVGGFLLAGSELNRMVQ